MCDDKINAEACEIEYKDDFQIMKIQTDKKIKKGTGDCVGVDVCGNCNDGFYGGSKYCYSKYTYHIAVTHSYFAVPQSLYLITETTIEWI